jgi:hypothetical protein
MSKFSLLCQAARLLGQVLKYLSGPVDDVLEMQLDRTLQAMVVASLEVEDPDYDQITFIYRYFSSFLFLAPCLFSGFLYKYWHRLMSPSTLLALHTPSLSVSHGNTAHYGMESLFPTDRAHQAIQQIISTIRINLLEKGCLFNRSPEEMPPWGFFYAYRTGVFQLKSREEDTGILEVTTALKGALRKLDTRWNAAGEF